ncbi:hypothetical protein BVG79_02149 [Ketogulonicigenium robustum]|uniref:Uncharacterized protein n=1 Tax=Ketogulonicigenium robustum TaxID=92947 RepID=A0A1W6P232_9RHOB|nr:DUF2793 domain-containing protein [Ketogulonicigenium robustum]ARO15489.1 hypothetical protein BVG79_02149 [Ketogulonicigenium robustum]
MPQSTTRLALPLVQPAQAQKHVTVNESLTQLDAAVQASVLGTTRATPPAAPVDGQCWLVAAGASGAWAGQDGSVAMRLDDGWHFTRPTIGWRLWDADKSQLLVLDANGWQVIGAAAMNNLPRIGINASADATNVLAVAGPASLLYNPAGGHQLKVNKAQTTDSATLLFQSGWSGRAEMGLAGEDDFSVKVSGDGGTFHTALRAVAATGKVEMPQGGTVQGKALVHLGNLLGPVAMTGGVPTGAVIESGSNTNGSFVRFANGTQICWRTTANLTANTAQGANFISGASAQTFAQPFAAAPNVQATANGSTLVWAYATATTATATTLRLAAPVQNAAGTITIFAIGSW